ncbi:MAG: AAA family ATPase [Candidatus Omnitrophica bacterium]|nr:AAA family ATPase [Candidatus Omnitrophota bacterium]
MYLERLEIFGFKSFPEKTSLKFEPGITVVVGPNGCGKSNILDAVRWSLGEQSPKSLRGTKMEDIIFNGTDKHAPLNYAEVSLVFDNEDKYLPIDYKEVAVTRRLYRSGESQYFINKNQVRLKDVQELFMGTGIGESTYSFVEQGKIEIFLGYKPEEKRLIFDEASGIIKYKERKRETMRRLKETDENLIRLEDIMSEVRRQIRYLERQVEKAKKYKEVEEKLVEIEQQVATINITKLDNNISSLSAVLDELSSKNCEYESAVLDMARSEKDNDDELARLRSAIEEVTNRIVTARALKDTGMAKINGCQQRARQLEERNVAIDMSKESLSQRLALQQERILSEQQRLEDFQSKVDTISIELKSLRDKKETLTNDVEDAKRKIRRDKEDILKYETEKVNSHNSLIEIQTHISSLLKRKQRLVLDKGKLEAFLSESEQKLSGVTEEVVRLEKVLSELNTRKAELSAQEKEVFTEREKLTGMLLEKEKEFVELKSCYEFLRDLRSKYETFSMKRKVTLIFDEEPKNINKLIISLKNAAITQEGAVYKTVLDAKIVSLEEHELELKMETVTKEISEIKSGMEEVERLKEEVSSKMLMEVNRIDEEKKKYHERTAERDNLVSECARVREEFEILNDDMRTALNEIEELTQQQTKMQDSINACEERLAIMHHDLSKNQEKVNSSIEEITITDIEIVKKEEQHQSLYKEKESMLSKVELLEEEKISLSARVQEMNSEKMNNETKIVELEQEVEHIKEGIEQAVKDSDMLDNEKAVLRAKETEFLTKQNVLRKDQQKLSLENEEIKTNIYNKKIEIQSIEYEKTKITDYLLQVYDIAFTALAQLPEDVNLGELNQEKEKLIKRKKSLGEVNLVAIEEFEELKKRDDFLNKEKDDLVFSRENLKKAIQKINRTSKEIFMDAFTKIEEAFKDNFRFLFGGGRAQIILLDKDNVLESGVEIEVQPPGKKLQNVSLLSGGEKALTAISLIFAIFKVRPSPLCVLDEIDAPLDEANVDRFNYILKEFSNFSQFLIITHNKKTMSNATCLYGVTMQEKGVSKLVSVKLAREEAASV